MSSPNNFFKIGFLKNWKKDIFFFFVNFFFYILKSISNAILNHLEAWIFKIIPSGQTMVGPSGDTEQDFKKITFLKIFLNVS